MAHPWKTDNEDKHADGYAPVWIHKNKAPSRAERRARAKQKKVRPAPARNKPYEKED
jgi:hypothetical protein